jgi:hypothetical protein
MHWVDSTGLRETCKQILVTNVRGVAPAGEEAEVTVGAAAANYANPLGRVSLRRPKPNALERASLIRVSTQQWHTEK